MASSYEIEVLEELDYNNLIILKIIERNPELTLIFLKNINVPFDELYEMVENNTLTEDIIEVFNGILDSIIVTSEKYISHYKEFYAQTNQYKVTAPTPTSTVTETPVKDKPIIVKKPRRFGLEKVKEEIRANGGKATLRQTVQMELNDVKNLNVRLNNKVIRDMFNLTDEEIDNDPDYLAIISLARIFKNKTRKILDKKSKNVNNDKSKKLVILKK